MKRKKLNHLVNTRTNLRSACRVYKGIQTYFCTLNGDSLLQPKPGGAWWTPSHSVITKGRKIREFTFLLNENQIMSRKDFVYIHVYDFYSVPLFCEPYS